MTPPVHLSARLGQVIRSKRKQLGLSQERLAAEAGLDRTFISLIERGRRRAALETVAQVAAALGTSVSELVAETEHWEADG